MPGRRMGDQCYEAKLVFPRVDVSPLLWFPNTGSSVARLCVADGCCVRQGSCVSAILQDVCRVSLSLRQDKRRIDVNAFMFGVLVCCVIYVVK